MGRVSVQTAGGNVTAYRIGVICYKPRRFPESEWASGPVDRLPTAPVTSRRPVTSKRPDLGTSPILFSGVWRHSFSVWEILRQRRLRVVVELDASPCEALSPGWLAYVGGKELG